MAWDSCWCLFFMNIGFLYSKWFCWHVSRLVILDTTFWNFVYVIYVMICARKRKFVHIYIEMWIFIYENKIDFFQTWNNLRVPRFVTWYWCMLCKFKSYVHCAKLQCHQFKELVVQVTISHRSRGVWRNESNRIALWLRSVARCVPHIAFFSLFWSYILLHRDITWKCGVRRNESNRIALWLRSVARCAPHIALFRLFWSYIL